MSANISPTDIQGFDKVRVNGEVNGDEYLEMDTPDFNEVFNLLNKPLIEALEFVNYGEDDIGVPESGAYSTGAVKRDHLEDYSQDWEKNKDAEVLMYFETEEGKIEYEVIMRDDTGVSQTKKVPSYIELKHNPSKHRYTGDKDINSVQRLALRNAFEYDQDFLENILEEDKDYIAEMDLITAFDRDGGIWDQFHNSYIPFSQCFRTDFKQIPKNSDIDFKGIEDSAPYIARYVTNEPQDGGISEQEAVSAGRLIGSLHAIGLDFSQDREPEELKLDYDKRFGESVILIDPELAAHTTEKRDLDIDYSLFNQQLLPDQNWRLIDEKMTEKREDIITRTKNSTKEWGRVLENELPEEWREELPQQRVLESNL